ncbi:ABC-2 family transporter protein [Pseudoalteromonas sp. MMG022]|uniref:ABC transporter permease n=1 Tax=Pseudoalteromonas sp. MMG022 TaxID=2909978 RepID=UPI001F2EFFA4|nr:ABC-2 family transporter protein [Pseudoalteromonas sp. MMG022]MCF6434900.1 ABC-2 family transporter protein [Pseudoalteromonas sp. MMG022]
MGIINLIKIELKEVAHFRMNLYAWLLSHPLQLLIIYLLWRGIFQFTDSIAGLGFQDVVMYYFLVHFINAFLSSAYSVNYQVWSDINEGGLDKYLCRPFDYLTVISSKNLARPCVDALFATPVLVVAVWYSQVQYGASSWLQFFIACVLSLLILIEIQKVIGLLSLWLEKVFGLRDILFSVMMLLSGQLLPLSLLPGWMGNIASYSPFAALFHAPISQIINTGGVAGLEAMQLQLFWLIVFALLGKGLWIIGRPKYQSLGG